MQGNEMVLRFDWSIDGYSDTDFVPLEGAYIGRAGGFWGAISRSWFYTFDAEGNRMLYATVDHRILLIPDLQSFRVEADPATITPSDTTSIAMHALDSAGDALIIPDETLLYVLLDEVGRARGGLLHPAFDSLVAGIGNLPYGSVRAGELKYVASGGAGGEFKKAVATVAAYLRRDTNVNGSTAISIISPFYLTFSEDPERYLPVKNDIIEVTATITPAPPEGSEVTFELTQADEFTWADGSTDPKTVEVTGNEATVKLKSKTWWGVASVKATYTPTDGQALTDEGQLPVDTDGDGMADSWELEPVNGGTLALGGSKQDGDWDKETSPGNANDGDGFTKYGEYQGVLIGKEHMRLTPTTKEVFFDISAASAGQYAVAQVEQQLGIEVHLFDNTGGLILRYLGVNKQRGSAGRVRVIDAGTPTNSAADGKVIRNGIYFKTGSRQQPRIKIRLGGRPTRRLLRLVL